MLTAQEARELVNNYYSSGYNLGWEIMIAACQGKREYTYRGELPLYFKNSLEALGYKVLETRECLDGVNKISHISITW